MIEELKKNIETEIEMLREISTYVRIMEFSPPSEKRMLEDAINSLRQSIKLINRSIPEILMNISAVQKLPASQPVKTNLEKVIVYSGTAPMEMIVRRGDKDKILTELSINESLIKKIRKKKETAEEEYEEFKAARGYLKLSNKFFQQTSVNLIKKGYFRPLSLEIKKANLDILFETYISMMFLSSFIALIASVFAFIFLMFFNIGLSMPFISLYSGDYFARLSYIIWLPIAVPPLVFFILYVYPSTEKSSIAKRIEQELPFAVIHMSAISGSGIEPSEIFRIIGLSKEYPYLKREIRKVLNQINLYGYDLVTALNNVARNTPSQKLSELYSGLATTIHSGGSLTEYFEKRAETLLMGYRLERERFIHTAETFMDIYISVVIAAPMIFMLLLIMMTVSQINVGFTSSQITLIIVLAISLVNVVFLGFLQVKQPSY